MKTSDSLVNFAPALAKAQAAMENAKKSSANPFFKSKYADLAEVVAAVKPALVANGLSYLQFPCTNDKDEVGVETMLMHSSGEWVRGDPFYVPVNKADAQGFGSAITYCRRYSLQSACGIAPEDDDGNAAAASAPGSDGVIERIKAANVTAKDAAGEAYRAYSEEHRGIIDGIADEVVALVRGDDLAGAAARCHEFCGDDLESQLALSYRLPSDVANKLKKHKAQERERARIDAVKRVPLASQA